jgi:hypothetical protein
MHYLIFEASTKDLVDSEYIDVQFLTFRAICLMASPESPHSVDVVPEKLLKLNSSQEIDGFQANLTKSSTKRKVKATEWNGWLFCTDDLTMPKSDLIKIILDWKSDSAFDIHSEHLEFQINPNFLPCKLWKAISDDRIESKFTLDGVSNLDIPCQYMYCGDCKIVHGSLPFRFDPKSQKFVIDEKLTEDLAKKANQMMKEIPQNSIFIGDSLIKKDWSKNFDGSSFGIQLQIKQNSDDNGTSASLATKIGVKDMLENLLLPFLIWQRFKSNPEYFFTSLCWIVNLISIICGVYSYILVLFVWIIFLGTIAISEFVKQDLIPDTRDECCNLSKNMVILTVFLASFSGIYYVEQSTNDAIEILGVISLILQIIYLGFIITLLKKVMVDNLQSCITMLKDSFYTNMSPKSMIDTHSYIHQMWRKVQGYSECSTILELSNTLGFLYNLIVVVLLYLVDFGPVTSFIQLHSKSYGFSVVILSLLGVSILIFVRKLLLSFQSNVVIGETKQFMNHVGEVLDYISNSPDMVIQGSELVKKDDLFKISEIKFTSEKLSIKYSQTYKTETKNVLEALRFQIVQEKGNNQAEFSFQDVIDTISDLALKSRKRMDDVEDELLALGASCEYKFLGVLTIDKSLIIKIMVGGGTAIGTAIFAYIKVNSNIQ